MMPDNCPFCDTDSDRVWLENDIGFALWGAFPITERARIPVHGKPGHTQDHPHAVCVSYYGKAQQAYAPDAPPRADDA